MTTVTGLTAARMAEVEGDSIVNAALSGDNLILTRGDSTTIDVGSVRGPQGSPGSGDATVTRNTFTPSWTGVTPGTGGSVSNTGVYTFAGAAAANSYGMLSIGVQLRFGSSSPVFPSGADILCNVPTGFLLEGGPTTITDAPAIGNVLFIPDDAPWLGVVGLVFKHSTTQVKVKLINWSTGLSSNPAATTPFTWSNTGGADLICFDIISTWARRIP